MDVWMDTKGYLNFKDVDKTNLLNDYFSNICTQDNAILPTNRESLRAPTNDFLESVDFSCTSTYKIRTKLINNLSSGPDGFPPLLYKTLAKSLALPVTLLCRKIFSCGVQNESLQLSAQF